MKERGLVLTGASTRAVLAGTKTQSRRLVVPQPSDGFVSFGELPTCGCEGFYGFHDGNRHYASPYGAPGDRLYVKEAWRLWDSLTDDADLLRGAPPKPASHDDRDFWRRHIEYRATSKADGDTPWRSPRFMPKWAARIWLELVSVRVERLLSISEEDARAEGVEATHTGEWNHPHTGYVRGRPFAHSFLVLWDSINGKRLAARWEANPWVWRLVFRRLASDADIPPHAAAGYCLNECGSKLVECTRPCCRDRGLKGGMCPKCDAQEGTS